MVSLSSAVSAFRSLSANYLGNPGPAASDPVPVDRGVAELDPLKDHAHVTEGAGSVIGTLGSATGAALRAGFLGEIPLIKENDPTYGIQALTRGAVPKLAMPQSLDEARELLETDGSTIISAAREEENRQLARMTPELRERYISSRDIIVRHYAEVEPASQKLFTAITEAGGWPDPAARNQATRDLTLAIQNNEYLQKRGVGPREYQILAMSHELGKLGVGDATARRVLQAQLYGHEKAYVLETLAFIVSDMRERGIARDKWSEQETWGLEIAKMYDRLREGKKLHAGDMEELQRLRSFLFPYTVDWQSSELQSVRDAEGAYKDAKKTFMEASHRFVRMTAAPMMERNKQAEQAAKKAQGIDNVFQIEQAQANLKVLEDWCESQGKTLDEADRKLLADAREAFKKSSKEYIKFWDVFLSGDDTKAREHRRNALDKESASVLLWFVQLTTYELFKKYDVKNADGTERFPSTVSFRYTNPMQVLDDAIRNGKVSPVTIEDYFSGFIKFFPRAAQAIGASIPFTNARVIQGRRLPDINELDRITLQVGSYRQSGDRYRIVVYGLGDKGYLLATQPMHPEVANLPGGKEAFDPATEDTFSQAGVIRSNHTGNKEFWMALLLKFYGIDAPQQAQAGAKILPVWGDYLAFTELLTDRDDPKAAHRAYMNYILRGKTLLSYTAGTRIVTPGGPDLFFDYAKHPELLLARRIVTDRLISGQVPKLSGAVQQDMNWIGDDHLLFTMIHDGSLEMPEPTWNLTSDKSLRARIKQVLENFGPYTMMNYGRLGNMRAAFGMVLSSAGYLSIEEWREAEPEMFAGLSDRQAYVLALQLNSSVDVVAMQYAASCLNVSPEPAIEGAQAERVSEIDRLSEKDREQRTSEPLRQHMEKRVARLRQALALPSTITPTRLNDHDAAQLAILGGSYGKPLPKRERRPKLSAVKGGEASQLAAVLPVAQAQELMGESFADSNPEAQAFIVEAMQRGAAVARKWKEKGESADAVALDLDKVTWDHFFVFEGRVYEALTQEIRERLGGKQNDKTLREVVNINPLWVAFMIGYQKEFGKPPVLFSSTIKARFAHLAEHIDRNPLIRRFFELAFEKEKLTVAAARELIAGGTVLDYNPRIITREKIARKVTELMDKFTAVNFNFDATQENGTPVFSDIEKEDIREILRTAKVYPGRDGVDYPAVADVHLKLRSLIAYRELVDDRSENVVAATRHEGVSAHEVEPFRHALGGLYHALDVDTHIRARLNQARSGVALQVMKAMCDEEHDGKHTVYPAHKRAQRIRGLFDRFVEIHHTKSDIEDYNGAKLEGGRAVQRVGAALDRLSFRQKQHMHAVRHELAELIRNNDTYTSSQASVPRVVRDHAVDALSLKPRPNKTLRAMDLAITDDATYELVADALRRIPDEMVREQALQKLAELGHPYIDILETQDLVGAAHRRGKLGWKEGMKLAQAAAGSLFEGAQHLVGTEMVAEVTSGLVARGLFSKSSDEAKLIRLAMQMEGLKGLPKPLVKFIEWRLGREPMSLSEQVEAYGIVAERLLIRYGLKAYANMLKDYLELADELKGQYQKIRAEGKTPSRELTERMSEMEKNYALALERREATEDTLRAAAKDVRRIIGDVAGLLRHGESVWEGLKRLYTDRLGSLSAAESDVIWNQVQALLRSVMAFFETLPDQKSGAKEEYISAAAVSGLVRGLGHMVGSDTVVGMVLDRFGRNIDATGLNHAVYGIVKLMNDTTGAMSDHAARGIVQHLEAGNVSKAFDEMVAALYLIRVSHGSAGNKESDKKSDELIQHVQLLIPGWLADDVSYTQLAAEARRQASALELPRFPDVLRVMGVDAAEISVATLAGGDNGAGQATVAVLSGGNGIASDGAVSDATGEAPT